MRIGLRLLLGFFLVLGLALFVVLRVLLDEVKPGTRLAMEDSLIDAAYTLAQLATPDMKAGTIAEGFFARSLQGLHSARPGATIGGFRKDSIDYRITITDAEGIVRFDTQPEAIGQDHSRWNDVVRTLRGEYGARSSPASPYDPDNTVMHVAAPIRDGDRTIGVLTVSRPNQRLQPYIDRSEQRILRWSWVLLGLSLLIGLLFSWWIASSLSRLRGYANAVSRGERAPLPVFGRVSGSTEFSDLAGALERMRLKLEDKAYVESYVHTLTHELKSPLAAIRGAAELLQEDMPAPDRQRFAGNIQRQAERLRRKSLGVRDELGQGQVVQGDPFLIGQALQNLLDNAIDFSPAQGELWLRLQKEGDGIEWSVRDQGPGIPDYARERLFERFYSLPRGEAQDKGSGLGLCLVKEVSDLHGGQVWVENVAQPTGCLARWRLPV